MTAPIQVSRQVSRRALLLGLAVAPLAACSGTGGEVGAFVDEGGFGNPTAHNILVLTGQMPFAIDLAQKFAREVPNTVMFDFDSARLDTQAQQILRQQANWIRQFPEVTFRVFGHADAPGSNGYNHALGMRRARAVVNFLVRNGVSRRRLEAVVSHGETQMLIPTQDRERQNRRAVTEVAGLLSRHPTVMNGQYAHIIFREYLASASPA